MGNTPKAPPIKTQGIKTKLVSFIKENISWGGAGRWIEPFLGSGAVLFNIAPDKAIVGDTNKHIIDFYSGIHDGTVSPSYVRSHLESEGRRLTSEGEKHYYRIRDRFNDTGAPLDFLFLNRSSFNGLMRFNQKGKFNTPFCRKPDRFRPAYITKIVNQVKWAADVMMGKDWEFLCADWSDIIVHAKAGDFVYVDPPYAGRFSDYFNKWNDNDSVSLERALKRLPCRFGYSMWAENRHRSNSRLFDVFSSYEIRTFEHFYYLGASEKLRNPMTEALVMGSSSKNQLHLPLAC